MSYAFGNPNFPKSALKEQKRGNAIILKKPLVDEITLPLEQNTLISSGFLLEKSGSQYKETLHEIFCELKQLHTILNSNR